MVQRAAELGFAAIALTDHDAVSGLAEAAEAADKCNIEFLPGVEISAHYGRFEVHVVGLGIDPCFQPLCEEADRLKEGRALRADEMINKLNKMGIPIDREDVEARTADGTIGRMHLAQELMDMGITRTVQEGFDKYIKVGRRAYVPKMSLSCEKAVDLIHQAGGLAIIGHPGVGKTTRQILQHLLKLPFDGIEVHHTRHSGDHVAEFRRVARDHNLLISGGSDCHGSAKSQPPEMGKIRLPYKYFEQIKSALQLD